MQQLPLIMLSDDVGVADVIGGVIAVKEGDPAVPLQVRTLTVRLGSSIDDRRDI